MALRAHRPWVAELGVSRFTYEPGARLPWGRRHREQEEIHVVVGGSGRAELDDEVIEIDTWDALRVAPAVIRSFEAGPKHEGTRARPMAELSHDRAPQQAAAD